jgi:signal peptidase II
MRKRLLRVLLILLIITMNIGCDQSTKFLAKNYLKNTDTIMVIDNYFVLRYAENSEAFLSLFSTLPGTFRLILLLILPSIALIITAFYLIRNDGLPLIYIFSLCSILGGGISNVMIDRLFNNQNVIDFMNIGIGSVRTGIFNFADLSIMVGVILILLTTFKHKKSNIGFMP